MNTLKMSLPQLRKYLQKELLKTRRAIAEEQYRNLKSACRNADKVIKRVRGI